MRIGYFADGPWGQNSFISLLNMKEVEIQFLCLRYDQPDQVLKKMAEKQGIPVLSHPNVNSADFHELIRPYQMELLVSMSFNQIFGPALIDAPKYHAINCHAGKLPFYRGRNILNWALINDEKEFGITVHYIDAGIDTGDIIAQKTFPITDKDTYETLLDTAYRECPPLLTAAVQAIIDGTVTRKKQTEIHPVGMYCGQRREGDENLNWKQTSRQVFNFVRAICMPGPMARSVVQRGNSSFLVKINQVKLVPDAPSYVGIPGQVLCKTKAGFMVKTLDSFVEIVSYQAEENIRVGDRLK